jgi:hypothetical protein
LSLNIAGLETGAPAQILLDGEPVEFQYTGKASDDGAEIMLRLGFDPGQSRKLEIAPATLSSTDLSRIEVPLENGAAIGIPGCELKIPPLSINENQVAGPFEASGHFSLKSFVQCDFELETRVLTRTASGPLFIDYELVYRFAQNHCYTVQFRCYRDEPIIEVAEKFSLGMNAELRLVLNPDGIFDSILSHSPMDFESGSQPVSEKLNLSRPRDVLCRLQLPVLGEWAIPNNRSWFALYDSLHEERGMLGVLGLYGDRWESPVQNMPEVLVKEGRVEWRAALCSGARHWLLYNGPIEKEYTPKRRFVFDRLHAEFNMLRLSEHLDLAGDEIYDYSCWNKPGVLGDDYRERAQRNVALLPPLQRATQETTNLALRVLLDPQPQDQQTMLANMERQLQEWVRDFQGFRGGDSDFNRSVIGFSRTLREMMLDYELLRKDEYLSDEQIKKLHSYFIFAARRIADQSRWPHLKTWLHPDHPESVRDFYTYPGEHKPDKLVWSNSLPNFQSDALCSLLHLSSLLIDHPDAQSWQRLALDDIERQLDAFCSESGAWEESINYALFTLSYFNLTFRIVKHRLGINYFEDERMRRFTGWLVRFFGPYDKRVGAYTFPGVGNARVPMQAGQYLLCYASGLDEDDPLRHDLMAVYQKMEPALKIPSNGFQYAEISLALSDVPEREYSLRPLESEHMEDLGVAMRHAHPSPSESYLFQKIGFWKDHYENDETSFNWYAKGTPLVMDYGTYTSDVAGANAHNLVEIPDTDSLQRGYLADSFFSEALDYTRCEVPVNLKLLHGRLRTFEEIDGPSQPPEYFYIGDQNPIGPKTWKTRMLLFIKPDYVVMFDRVFGPVPHRFNLHVTADEIQREGNFIRARGRFDMDLKCFVQYPRAFEFEQGVLIPGPERYGESATNPHRQNYFRLYNASDGVYRTLLFAQERGREVGIEKLGARGMQVSTPEYTDIVFLGDEVIHEKLDDVEFIGRAGWIRQHRSGEVIACVPDGDLIAAFSQRITGRGPWGYDLNGRDGVLIEGPPRVINREANHKSRTPLCR